MSAMTEKAQALIAEGVDWAVAQDRAFLADEPTQEAIARSNHERVVAALAYELSITIPEAEERILMAMPD